MNNSLTCLCGANVGSTHSVNCPYPLYQFTGKEHGMWIEERMLIEKRKAMNSVRVESIKDVFFYIDQLLNKFLTSGDLEMSLGLSFDQAHEQDRKRCDALNAIAAKMFLVAKNLETEAKIMDPSINP